MTFKQTFDAVTKSESFKQFKEKNPKAELIAGFFILDFLSHETKQSLDYKSKDKIFTFELDNNDKIIMKEDELIKDSNSPKLEKINPKTKIETDELKSIAGERALDEGISSKFQKIIAVLQMYEKKQVWNLTCILDGLIILHSLIDSETGEIVKFERKNMSDFIRKK